MTFYELFSNLKIPNKTLKEVIFFLEQKNIDVNKNIDKSKILSIFNIGINYSENMKFSNKKTNLPFFDGFLKIENEENFKNKNNKIEEYYEYYFNYFFSKEEKKEIEKIDFDEIKEKKINYAIIKNTKNKVFKKPLELLKELDEKK